MVRGARPVPLSVRAVAHKALVAVTPRRRISIRSSRMATAAATMAAPMATKATC